MMEYPVKPTLTVHQIKVFVCGKAQVLSFYSCLSTVLSNWIYCFLMGAKCNAAYHVPPSSLYIQRNLLSGFCLNARTKLKGARMSSIWSFICKMSENTFCAEEKEETGGGGVFFQADYSLQFLTALMAMGIHENCLLFRKRKNQKSDVEKQK